MRDEVYFLSEADKQFNIESMKKYTVQKQELDKVLETMIAPSVVGKQLNILDACCGIGHVSLHLHELSPQSKILGIDQTAYLIEEAHKLSADTENVRFEVDDLYRLSQKYPKQFDVSVIWKTLSWLPYYDRAIDSLFGATKHEIYLSSLFYDGDIDFEIKVREYKKASGADGHFSYYNVYSLPRFQEYCLSRGARHIEVHDFNIPFDINRQSPDMMGTYTERLADGRRLQLSGAVVMSWKIIKMKLSDLSLTVFFSLVYWY